MKRRLSSTGRSPWPLMSTSWWWILECPEDACDLLHQVLGAHGHHPKEAQTWDLSKILHCRIFRPKILQSQFCLISSVLVIKTQRNEWKWRNLHCWQNFTLLPAWINLTSEEANWVFHFRQIDHQALDSNFVIKSLSTLMEKSSPPIFWLSFPRISLVNSLRLLGIWPLKENCECECECKCK